MPYIPLGCKRPVGYCRLHKKTMSLRQIKRKACLKKKCRHLVRCKHPYWEQREQEKRKKKETEYGCKGTS